MNHLLRKDLRVVKLYCRTVKACKHCRIWDYCDKIKGTFQKVNNIKNGEVATITALAAGILTGRYIEEDLKEE